jgi:hypothetical protein
MLAQLKSLYAKADQDLKKLWNTDKMFLFAFGALVLFIKFRDILISLLVSSSKRIDTNAQKQDTKLAAQENQANTQANALAAQAAALPSTETPVSEDWNTK